MPPETPATTAAKPAADVIHDIGYRHYDGPRLGRAYARRSLFTQSLRGAYGLGRSAKSKVMPLILYGLMCLVAIIIAAVAIATSSMTKLPIDYTDYALIMQVVIAIYLAAQAPQTVSRDLRFKTVPLYFSRPIERFDYVAAKYAAMSAALFILTATPVLLLYLGALLAKFDFSTNTKGFLQALVSVALLSLVYAGVGLLVAALTPRRGFGVAAVIAAMTVPYGAVAVIQGISWEQGNTGAMGWVGLFSPVSLIDNVQATFLGAAANTPDGIKPSTAAGTASLFVCFVLIAGCFVLLQRRYRKAGL